MRFESFKVLDSSHTYVHYLHILTYYRKASINRFKIPIIYSRFKKLAFKGFSLSAISLSFELAANIINHSQWYL
jgi:hypothetical protein